MTVTLEYAQMIQPGDMLLIEAPVIFMHQSLRLSVDENVGKIQRLDQDLMIFQERPNRSHVEFIERNQHWEALDELNLPEWWSMP